jgi:hypothetical protein
LFGITQRVPESALFACGSAVPELVEGLPKAQHANCVSPNIIEIAYTEPKMDRAK